MAGKTEEAKKLEKLKKKKERLAAKKKELVEIIVPPYGEGSLPTDKYLSINGKTITIQQHETEFNVVKVPRPYADLYANTQMAQRVTQQTRRLMQQRNEQ